MKATSDAKTGTRIRKALLSLLRADLDGTILACVAGSCVGRAVLGNARSMAREVRARATGTRELLTPPIAG